MISVWLGQELWRARFGLVPRLVFGLLPLFLLPVLRPLGTEALRFDGHEGLDGSLVLGPGLATMFAIVSLVFLGRTCFDEHYWRTGRRHEASGSFGSALVAKAVVNWAALLIQQAILFVAFRWLFDFRPAAGWTWFLPVVAAGMASIVALGMLVFVVARTISEFNLLPYIGSVLLAGLGSGFIPPRFTPEWATTVGPVFPTTQYLHAVQDLAIEGTTSGVASATFTITAMTGAIGLVAYLVHRIAPAKVG